MTPRGERFKQAKARELAESTQDLILVCARYEGYDERVTEFVDEQISIGDFVLTGGELSHTTGLHIPVDAGVAAAFLR